MFRGPAGVLHRALPGRLKHFRHPAVPGLCPGQVVVLTVVIVVQGELYCRNSLSKGVTTTNRARGDNLIYESRQRDFVRVGISQ